MRSWRQSVDVLLRHRGAKLHRAGELQRKRYVPREECAHAGLARCRKHLEPACDGRSSVGKLPEEVGDEVNADRSGMMRRYRRGSLLLLILFMVPILALKQANAGPAAEETTERLR